MHHEEEPSGRSHWDELAEQLGLPPDGTHTSPKMDRSDEIKRPQPSIHRELSNLAEGTKAPDERLEDTLAPVDLPSETEPGSDDERPARRRRGRRGGRRHREAREGSDSERTRRPRSASRGDKRPRKTRPSPEAEEVHAEELPPHDLDLEQSQDDHDLEPETPPNAPAETDDEEIEKISEWNIPSWVEIVSGLYRP
jgi:hypothetical protein